MVDKVSTEQRSKNMSRIRGRNTRLELVIRKGLHGRGFRYRLHAPTLPGKPDMMFPKSKTVIFINGCFWHGHDCALFREPKTNVEFWRQKISKNRENDRKNIKSLQASGWRVLTIWECSIRNNKKNIDKIIDDIVAWLNSVEKIGNIRS